MNTFFQKPIKEWSDLEKRAFQEVQEIYKRHNEDAEARYGAWEAMVWLSSQPELKIIGKSAFGISKNLRDLYNQLKKL